MVDDVLDIATELDAVGATSFALRYRLVNQHGVEGGWARTVHCTIDPATERKPPLPAAVRERWRASSGRSDPGGLARRPPP